MSQNVLTLAPGGQSINQTLGFGALSVMVDNLTSSYTRLPDAGKDIPPWVYGAVVSLPLGTNRARASLVATTPAVAGPPVPAAQATLTWVDQALPPSAGHLLQQSQYTQPQELGVVTATAGNTTGKSISIPAGIVSIGYGVDFTGSFITPNRVVVAGDQTLNPYRSDVNPGNPPVHASLLMPSDTSVTVTVTAPGGGPSRVRVLGWTVPVTTTVTPDVAIPTPVTFLNVAAGFAAQPAPWQAATTSLPLSGGIGAGGTQTAIPAPGAGVSNWLHTLTFIPGTAGTFGTIREGAGGTIRGEWAYANGNPIPFDFDGLQMASNTALVITNDSGSNLTSEAGMVSYTPA